MSVKYTFSITNNFPNQKVTSSALSSEISDSTITIALDNINTVNDDCDIWFKANLASAEETTLSGVVAAHTAPLPNEPPIMADGRPIIRADTRPLTTQTVFTMKADDVKIGDGNALRWDFSNNDDMYTAVSGSNGPTLASGIKAKQLDLKFNDPIYLKDGTIYFFDAPWGAYCSMYIVVPAGNYYPNDYGSIPASVLGLPGTQMYAYAAIDVYYANYVYFHYVYGSCPMGDELNAEGCQVEALPVGWILRGILCTLDSDNTSRGFASFELYRGRTIVLPGDPLGE
jgi:hypothetical protein